MNAKSITNNGKPIPPINSIAIIVGISRSSLLRKYLKKEKHEAKRQKDYTACFQQKANLMFIER